MNEAVWRRDGGCCVLCDSPYIIGLPGEAGAHHILGRNFPHSNDPMYCCLLCSHCHTDDIHTVIGRGRCLAQLQLRYSYIYPDNIKWYIEEYVSHFTTH